jgi:hypothetical protein
VQTFDDVHDLDRPQRVTWGGGFSFGDPEGNIWDTPGRRARVSTPPAASSFPNPGKCSLPLFGSAILY